MNKFFKATKTVQLAPEEEYVNGYGQISYRRGEPRPQKVVGWYVTGGQERAPDGHVYQVTYDAVLFAESGDIGFGDNVELPGVGWCTVEGPPANYDNGPTGSFSPGVEQITLRRVSGWNG